MFLDTYTVSFFGHRRVHDFRMLEERLSTIIRNVLWEKEYVEFLVGKNGEFDRVATAVVSRMQERCGTHNSSLVLILPYMTAEFRDNEKYYYDLYDEVEVCHAASKAHFKAAIQIRNREMIDRSDLAICYLEREEGGAFQTVAYAKSLGKQIINLAENTEEEMD